jgi:hypothetical protein
MDKVINPTAICISKFDLLHHLILYELSEEPYASTTSTNFFDEVDINSKQLSEFLERRSSTVHPVELKSKFRHIKYFPVAPFGNDSYPAIWDRRTPKGLLAPFLWLLKELKILPEQ